VEFIGRAKPVRAAYLFGSQINGTAHEFSDIDLAVFVRGVENWDFQKRVDLAVQVRIQVDNDVEVHFFPGGVLDNPPVASFAEYVIENGIRIWGEE